MPLFVRRNKNRMLFSRTSFLFVGVCCFLPHITSAFVNTRPKTAFRSPLTRRTIVSRRSSCKTSLTLEATENSHESIEPSSSTTVGARIAYLVVVHNRRTIEDAVHLFRAIRAEGNIIIIHVDTKLDWNVYVNSELYQEVEHHSYGATVVVSAVHSADWSAWSMNDPTHWGMELATTRFRGEWDIFINLSGDCMPVYNSQVMSELFDPIEGPLRNTNFVTSSSCETGLLPTSAMNFPEYWHKRNHYGQPTIEYVDDNGQEQETTLVVHWGSQWMALQPDFVDYLVKSLERPDSLASRYKDEIIHTERLMTDETFIPTLLMKVSPFNETLPDVNEDGSLKALPSLRAMRYERMDEHMPTAFGYYPTEQRYEVPESSLADEPKVWGPYFLGVYDLANIKESGALFIRKVSVLVDRNIVDLLPVKNMDDLPSIQWPEELKISPLPNWEKKMSDYLEQKDE